MVENDLFPKMNEALQTLARGEMVVVVDDYNRENEGDLVAIAEKVTPETVNFMATHGRGLICQPITEDAARRLALEPMERENSDPHHTAFTVSVDHRNTNTGISAYERALTVQRLADPRSAAEDFNRPGHIFPLVAKKEGVFARRGHTEAAVDMARLAGASPSGLICEIMREDGHMARLPELKVFARKHHLPMISVEELVRYRDAIGDVEVEEAGESFLPTRHGSFKITVYHTGDPAAREIVVLESEAATPLLSASGDRPPLVRLHSECLTGEAFGSSRCDCGPQLETALSRIGAEGGALVYLKQEGRGIGLAEKIKAYALQDGGADTFDANLALGHGADERRFGAAAAILRRRGYSRVRLMTNNPAKERALSDAGIEVSAREALVVGVLPENTHYLRTKAEKFGHILQGV